jgi:hypothetical protein
MAEDHVATATTAITAPRSDVWRALVNAVGDQEYMFGTGK